MQSKHPPVPFCRFSMSLPALACLVFAAACAPEAPSRSPEGPGAEASRPVVVTTSLPVDYLVAYLAGEAVDRRLVLPPGGDPAHGSPPAEAILEVQRADRVLGHLEDYEGWTKTASLPVSKVVWTAAGLDLAQARGRTHSHGPGGEHSHGAVYPSTFLDPLLFLDQARAVQRNLAELDGPSPEDTAERLGELEGELRTLAADLERLLASEDGSPLRLWTADPGALVYWQHRYGLEVLPTADGGAEPRDGELRLFLSDPAADGAAPAVLLDTLDLAAADGSYDYLARARANHDRLRRRLGDGDRVSPP